MWMEEGIIQTEREEGTSYKTYNDEYIPPFQPHAEEGMDNWG